MTEKKIAMTPIDMERLRELMRQEEAKLDAADPTDAELSAWEQRHEEALKQLAKRTPNNLPALKDEMDRNWAALQEKLQGAAIPSTSTSTQRAADVLPLKSPVRHRPLPWLGLLAAAALVVMMVRLRSPDDLVTMNDQNIQVKGASGPSAVADCEVDVAALDGSKVMPAADGQGFIGTPGAWVELSVRCNSSGSMRAELQGPEQQTLITSVVHGERQRILQDGQVARIPLQSGRPWVISLTLTDQEFSKDEVIPQAHILWQDKISLGVPQ